MNKFFVVAILLISPSICQSESFTPKVVCLSDSEEFLGWMTKSECEKMKGISPNIISKGHDNQSRLIISYPDKASKNMLVGN